MSAPLMRGRSGPGMGPGPGPGPGLAARPGATGDDPCCGPSGQTAEGGGAAPARAASREVRWSPMRFSHALLLLLLALLAWPRGVAAQSLGWPSGTLVTYSEEYNSILLGQPLTFSVPVRALGGIAPLSPAAAASDKKSAPSSGRTRILN